ncbi:MAG: YkgJ family cysteine cluster protein [Nitrospirota bacterium]|nr:MAG: YkgJ family cysteine cluster protein [Nitrospirota bacterium]
MPKKKRKKKEKERVLSCDECSDCCLYMAIEVDTPTCKKDYSDFMWYLYHKDISVFIDHDRSWNLEIRNVCDALDDSGLCKVYDDRPVICRKYEHDTCTTHSKGEYFVEKFDTVEQLKKYLDKKGIDYKFKRMPK